MENLKSVHVNHSVRHQRLLRSLKGGEYHEARQLNEQHAAKLQTRKSNVQIKSNGNEKKSIGIIGAGIAGLYTAYLLDQANQKHGNVFHVKIIESSNRSGGRILTHRFEEYDPAKPETEFQYGEFGAMRIPRDHKAVVKLFDDLKVKLIPFLFENPTQTLFYMNGSTTDNGQIMTKQYAMDHAEELGFVPIKIINPLISQYAVDPADFSGIQVILKPNVKREKYKSVKSLYDAVYDELAKELKPDDEAATDEFLTKYDKYTVFGYFHERIEEYLKNDCENYLDIPAAKKQGLIDGVLHFGEVTASGTGLNHLALVESVLDNNHFHEGQEWVTAEHGMESLTNALRAHVEKTGLTIQFNKRVSRLRKSEHGQIEVDIMPADSNKKETQAFDRVVVCTPFASTRYFIPPDTDFFSYGKRQAIRTLNYDISTKVFAQFSDRWWEQLKDTPQKGGVSSTDLPVKNVVYPSYGVGRKEKGVLLCSYTWQNDAVMLANISDEACKQVIIDSLATLHNYPELRTQDIKIARHTWLEPFAMFRPGQFNLMVNGMIPESGVHFAGEHLSVNHGWILGALNSASRAVREILVLEGLVKTAEEAYNEFPDNEFDAASFAAYMKHVSPPKNFDY